MARGAKVKSRDAYFQTSSEDDSNCESKPSYKTLAKIATEQQKAMEHIQKLLDKSDDLLDVEMTRSQSLIADIKDLHVKYKELEGLYESLSKTHEKLSHDSIQRKREVEKLKAAREDLQKENESLHAQLISSTHEEFEPPCLKCIERDNATSVAECSTVATVAISSTIDVVTNPSAVETTTIADENARLKTLLETWMYKSLKGHQTLCNVLKKQILNRNPRKEGVGFDRKMNVDGSYWKLEQYPKITWVAAKEPSVDPSTLYGFTCANPIIIDESFDANYKLFKNQNGEVFERYIGTNCKNGPPMKKIWVPKGCLEKLPANVIMTPLGKKTNPRPKASYGPKASYRQKTHLSHPDANVLQKTILRPMNMSVFPQTAIFIKQRIFLLILMSIILLLQDYLLGLQSQNSQMLLLDSLLLSHP